MGRVDTGWYYDEWCLTGLYWGQRPGCRVKDRKHKRAWQQAMPGLLQPVTKYKTCYIDQFILPVGGNV